MDQNNKVIVKETPLYILYGPTNQSTAGFFILSPKVQGSKRNWAVRVINHLRAYSDPISQSNADAFLDDQITYQSTHRYSFNYHNGSVGVIPELGIVEISQNHPDMDNVILGLVKLMVSQSNNERGRAMAGIFAVASE